jgi:hypothetical protein
MLIAFDGVIAGLAHVVSGPDHLAGVAPLAAAHSRRMAAARVGALWGFGHGLGVLALGAASELALSAAQVELASSWAERLVGVVLVALGTMTLWRARRVGVETHAHGGATHTHVHLAAFDVSPLTSGGEIAAAPHAHRPAPRVSGPIGMGLLHGLAGASHLWAVLPILALRGMNAALYLVSYLVASVVAMVAFGLALGAVIERFGARAAKRALASAGALSLGVGVFWLVNAWQAH